jgi:hypothetical protein
MSTSRFVSGHNNHQVLGPSDVIHDCITVAVPAIDAKRELGSVHCHLRTENPHGGQAPSGASRRPRYTNTEETAWTRLTNAGAGSLFRLMPASWYAVIKARVRGLWL